MKLCGSCHNGLFGAPAFCPVCGSGLEHSAEVSGHELVGMRVADRYELVELVGEGAMGWVYRGAHLSLGRSVAVKLLKTAGDADAGMVARFEQEARAASRLDHPHIVSVIDFGTTPGGMLYLVTEFVHGSNLGELLVLEGTLSLQRTLAVFHQILAAVEEAHSQQVIHRDLKPENIVLTPLRSGEDFVKVLDFGIAILADEPKARITAAGAFAGTPGYMAPETIRTGASTERSDIYALGNVLFELLTGRSLFQHEWPMALLTMHVNDSPPRFSEVAPELGLPEAFEQLLARMVAKDPADRPASIAELRAELFEAARQVGEVELGCNRCARPRDPYTGLCSLHGAHSHPSPRSSAPGRTIAAQGVAASSPQGSATGPRAQRPEDGTSQALVQTSPLRRAALVGRAIEASPCAPAGGVDEVVDFLLGSGALLEIAGELGSGRRCLLDATATIAERLGMVVHRLVPDDRLALRPWYPVRALVGELLGCGPTPSSEAPLVESASAHSLDPRTHDGLRMLFGFEPSDAPEPGPGRQLAIADAVAGLLTAPEQIPQGGCLVVYGTLDVDRATQGLVRGFARRLRGKRLKLVVGSDGGSFTSRAGRRVTRTAPIDESTVAVLLERLGAPEIQDAASLARKVVELSGGNAFHAEQVVRAYLDGVRIDGTAQELVARRVAMLPVEGQQLLRAICAIGARVPLELAAEQASDEERLLAADLLYRRGMIVTDDEGLVSPVHPLFARHVVESMPAADRRALHADLCTTLQRSRRDVFVLAHHGFEADVEGHSLPWLIEASEAACRWSDHETAALVHYRRASHVARWHMLLADDDPRQLDLSFAMADALVTAGHLASAEAVLKGVLGLGAVGPEVAARARQCMARLQRARPRGDESAAGAVTR